MIFHPGKVSQVILVRGNWVKWRWNWGFKRRRLLWASWCCPEVLSRSKEREFLKFPVYATIQIWCNMTLTKNGPSNTAGYSFYHLRIRKLKFSSPIRNQPNDDFLWSSLKFIFSKENVSLKLKQTAFRIY